MESGSRREREGGGADTMISHEDGWRGDDKQVAQWITSITGEEVNDLWICLWRPRNQSEK